MRSEWKWLAVLLTAAYCCQAEIKVVRNFTLIDGTGQRALPNAAMVVVDGRIDWVGPAADLKAPAGGRPTVANPIARSGGVLTTEVIAPSGASAQSGTVIGTGPGGGEGYVATASLTGPPGTR